MAKENATPPGAAQNVLNQLSASPQPTELLMSLREFCNERLKERGEAALIAFNEERLAFARDANLEVLALADLLQKEIIERDSTGEFLYVARGILKRIKELSDIVYDAALRDEDEESLDLSGLRLKLLGVSAS